MQRRPSGRGSLRQRRLLSTGTSGTSCFPVHFRGSASQQLYEVMAEAVQQLARTRVYPRFLRSNIFLAISFLLRSAYSFAVQGSPDRAFPKFALAFVSMLSPKSLTRRATSLSNSSETRDVFVPRSLATRATSSPRSWESLSLRPSEWALERSANLLHSSERSAVELATLPAPPPVLARGHA